MSSLLPHNSTKQERVLEAVIERASTIPVAIRDIWTPKKTGELPSNPHAFASYPKVDIMPPIELPGNAAAQQGTCVLPDGRFLFSENFDEDGHHKSRIVIVSSDLRSVLHERVISNDLVLWGGTSYSLHLGQPNFRHLDGYIYVGCMSLGTNRSGVLRFNLNLEFQQFINWSGISPYLDAICFKDEKIFFDYGVLCTLNFSVLLSNPSASFEQLQWTKYDYDTSTYSISQGLQIKNGKLYAVPECDPESPRTKPGHMGVIVYDIASLVPRPSVGDHIINYPEKEYYFEIPELGRADHEAMDFVLGKDDEFWISTAADGGKNLYRVVIKPELACPESFLPWLAWAYSVDNWNPEWDVEKRRSVIQESMAIHQKKGTIGALKTALATIGYLLTVIEWFTEISPADPYTFRLLIDAQDEPITQQNYVYIERVINDTKNQRSFLSKITVERKSSGSAPILSRLLSSEINKVFPEQIVERDSTQGITIGSGESLGDTIRIFPIQTTEMDSEGGVQVQGLHQSSDALAVFPLQITEMDSEGATQIQGGHQSSDSLVIFPLQIAERENNAAVPSLLGQLSSDVLRVFPEQPDTRESTSGITALFGLVISDQLSIYPD